MAKDPGDDEEWDDLLSEKEKASGISPDMARAILSMNPKLREEGKNTAWVVHNSQNAQQAREKGVKPTPAPQPAGPVQVKAGADIFGIIDELGKHLQAEQTRIDDEKKRLDEERKKLEAQQAALKTKLLQQFTAWLLGKDPELLSPFTQQALTERKPFLERIGFSVKHFADMKKQLHK